jgi:hypothetical protein
MMAMRVSLGVISGDKLYIIQDRQTRLNPCLRGYDIIISPESFYKGDRGDGLETPAKRSSIELKGEEVRRVHGWLWCFC